MVTRHLIFALRSLSLLVFSVGLLGACSSGAKLATIAECEKSCTRGKCIEGTAGSASCYCGVSKCEFGCVEDGESCSTTPTEPLKTCAELSCAADQKCVSSALAGASCQPKECADITCTAAQKCVPAGGGVSATCAEKTCDDLTCAVGEACIAGPPALCAKTCSTLTCDSGFYCVPHTDKAPECARLPGGSCSGCANGYCRQDQAGAAITCVVCPTEVEPNDAITGGPPAGHRYSQQRLYRPEQATKSAMCAIIKYDTPANDGTHDCVQPDCALTSATTTCPVDTTAEACTGGTGGAYCPVSVAGSSAYECISGATVSDPKGGSKAQNASDPYALQEWDTLLNPCLPGYRYSVRITALDAGATIDRLRVFEARDTPDGTALVVLNGSPLALGADRDFMCPPAGKVAVAVRPVATSPAKRLLVTVSPSETYQLCSGPGPKRTCGNGCHDEAINLAIGSACGPITGPPAGQPSPNTSDAGCTQKFLTHGLASAECVTGSTLPVRAAKGCLCGTGSAQASATEGNTCDLTSLDEIGWSNGTGLRYARFGAPAGGDPVAVPSTALTDATWMDWWRVPCVAGRTIKVSVEKFNMSTLQPAITVLGDPGAPRNSYSTCFDAETAPVNGATELRFTCDGLYALTNPASAVGTPYYIYVAVHPSDAQNPGTPDPTNYFNYSISTTFEPIDAPLAKNYTSPLTTDQYRTSAFCKNRDGSAFRLSHLYTCR